MHDIRKNRKVGTSMKMPWSDIKAEWFYVNEEGKTKLNWFLYEVALEYQEFIRNTPELKPYKKTHGDRNVALFCTHFAKEMKKSLLERLEGKTDNTIIYEEYITDFYPGMPRKQVNLLLEAAGKAWGSQLSICETCPTRCISEKEEWCVLFDDYRE